MKNRLSTTFCVVLCLLASGCGFVGKQDGKADTDAKGQTVIEEDEMEFTELEKVQLPCTKDELSAAWKKIGVVEQKRKKILDYKQNVATLFLSTDLDGDGVAEVLMRGEPPYAAIFTCLNDSLHLITYVDHAEMGLAITTDGTIMRHGTNSARASISEFIRLENSLPATTGMARETFSVQGNQVVSEGTQYSLRTDSALVKVSKEAYQKVAPQGQGTYIEEIDGWEDLRTP